MVSSPSSGGIWDDDEIRPKLPECADRGVDVFDDKSKESRTPERLAVTPVPSHAGSQSAPSPWPGASGANGLLEFVARRHQLL
jgi:hypothetical protein